MIEAAATTRFPLTPRTRAVTTPVDCHQKLLCLPGVWQSQRSHAPGWGAVSSLTARAADAASKRRLQKRAGGAGAAATQGREWVSGIWTIDGLVRRWGVSFASRACLPLKNRRVTRGRTEKERKNFADPPNARKHRHALFNRRRARTRPPPAPTFSRILCNDQLPSHTSRGSG